MKAVACVAASVLALFACNKGPEVDLHNADTNQVSKSVTQSGVMTSDAMVEPGLWQSKVSVLDMTMPGMPPEFAARMKEEVAKHRNEASKHCIKPEDVKKPKEGFFGADKSCRYDHFTMGGGKIDVSMTCNEEGRTQNTKVAGSYTSTSYSIDASSVGNGGGEGGMSMKMHVDAQRVGECTAKDD